MKRIYKKPKKPEYIVSIARKLRKNSTHAEELLWDKLRNRKFLGLKFKRQATFGRNVLDFYCKEKRLAIEVDGKSHEGKKSFDQERDQIIEGYNILTIRFTNDEVIENIEGVLDIIQEEVKM